MKFGLHIFFNNEIYCKFDLLLLFLYNMGNSDQYEDKNQKIL